MLNHADLSDVDLSDAVLEWARLRYAGLRNANLKGANLDSADLSDAKGFSGGEFSLQGATMPDGQKYEEDREAKKNRREDRENIDSS